MKHAIETLRREAMALYRALPGEGWADTRELRESMLQSIAQHYEAATILESKVIASSQETLTLDIGTFLGLKRRDPYQDVEAYYEGQDALARHKDPEVTGPICNCGEYFRQDRRHMPDCPMLPRTPDGHINNCSLANHDLEANCQMCDGKCPDRS